MAPIHRFLGQYVKIRDRGEVLCIKLQFETVEINICRRLCPELHPFLSKILLSLTKEYHVLILGRKKEYEFNLRLNEDYDKI